MVAGATRRWMWRHEGTRHVLPISTPLCLRRSRRPEPGGECVVEVVEIFASDPMVLATSKLYVTLSIIGSTPHNVVN